MISEARFRISRLKIPERCTTTSSSSCTSNAHVCPQRTSDDPIINFCYSASNIASTCRTRASVRKIPTKHSNKSPAQTEPYRIRHFARIRLLHWYFEATPARRCPINSITTPGLSRCNSYSEAATNSGILSYGASCNITVSPAIAIFVSTSKCSVADC